jgi:hypothetical protein
MCALPVGRGQVRLRVLRLPATICSGSIADHDPELHANRADFESRTFEFVARLRSKRLWSKLLWSGCANALKEGASAGYLEKWRPARAVR